MAPLTNKNTVKQQCVASIVTTLIWTMGNEIMVTTRKVLIQTSTKTMTKMMTTGPVNQGKGLGTTKQTSEVTTRSR